MNVQKCDYEAENNSRLQHGHGIGSIRRSGTFNSAGRDIVFVLPTLEPLVEPFHRATVLPIAEGDPPVLAIVSHLENGGFVVVLIEFEDEIGGEIRVFDNTGGALFIFVDAPFVILVYALSVGEVHSR